MDSSAVGRRRYVVAGLLLLSLLSMISPAGHGATLPTTNVRNDSLFLTVNPDKSVVIGANMTTYSQSLQNATLFPPGYAIQATSSFSQQTNAVVETTNVQYLIPSKLNQNLSQIINSISFTGSQTGLSGQGSLKVIGVLLSPIENINVTYTTSSSQVMVNASALVQFSPSYSGISPLFSNYTSFNTNWTATFGSSSWRDPIVTQIENSTGHILTVTAFNGTITPALDLKTAVVKIGFVAVASGTSGTTFVGALVNLLNTFPPALQSGLGSIIQSLVNLETGETVTMTYTGTSGIVSYTSTTDYVSNLDSQLNLIKGQFFQLLFNTDPILASNPTVSFLNATSITVSKISTKTSLDPNSGIESTSLSGLMINPQLGTGSTSTNFTIPGLFQILGTIPVSAPGLNVTITGGSDSSNQVKIVAGTLPPTSTTSNSATWTNVNASKLQDVRFLVQPQGFSILTFLTSTPGFILEAVIAAAVIAGVALYARKRRSKMSPPVTPIGPTPPPGFSPGPPAPTQSTAVLGLQTS